jgi:hypothetical protein
MRNSRSTMRCPWLILCSTLLFSASGEGFENSGPGFLPLRAAHARQLPLKLLPRPTAARVTVGLRGGALPAILNFDALSETVVAMGTAAPLGFCGILCGFELLGIPAAPMGPLAGEILSFRAHSLHRGYIINGLRPELRHGHSFANASLIV